MHERKDCLYKVTRCLAGMLPIFYVNINCNQKHGIEIWTCTGQTRLHSSRMRTARALTVSPSMLCARGGCMVGGWVGAWSRGGWVHGPGGGGCGGIPACTEADSPPVNRMTDRCKNIRFRAVIKRWVLNALTSFPRIEYEAV